MTEAQFRQVLSAGQPLVYTGFVALGAAVGGFLMRRDARAWTVTAGERAWVFGSVFIGGLAGSALPAFVSGGLIQENAERYLIGPKTILGGLLCGFLAVAVYKKVAGVAAETSDAFARGAAAMMAIGRLGCYFAHCCLGVPSDVAWAQDFGDGVRRLPIQLVEAAVLFALLAALQILHARGALPDRRLFVFFAAYGLARFGLEFWRETVAGRPAGLGFYQWLALIVAGVGGYQIAKRTRLRRSAPLAEVA